MFSSLPCIQSKTTAHAIVSPWGRRGFTPQLTSSPHLSGALRGTLDPSVLASNVNCHRYLVSFHISHCISTSEPWCRVLGSLWQFVSSLWVFSTFLWFPHYSWCSLPLQSLWFMLVAAKTENMAEAR